MYKSVFILSAIGGTTISISAYSWFSMWMGLEISLLSVIPLFNSQKNMLSSEASMKYFITQAMASLVLLMAINLMLLTSEFMKTLGTPGLKMIMDSALATKLGAAPFHFWFPEVMEGLSWLNCLILLTLQKIAPLTLIMSNSPPAQMMEMMIISSLMMSVAGAMNQISLRKIMAFSSISHIAWMLASTLISAAALITYLSIYCMMNASIIFMMNSTRSFYMTQVNNSMNQNKSMKIAFMMNLLSLAGIPPLLGFMPKWVVINWMLVNWSASLAVTMVVITLMMAFVYIRIALSSLSIGSNEPKVSISHSKSPLTTMTTTLITTGLVLSTSVFNFH